MCIYIQVHGNSASRNAVCTEKNLWTGFSKAKVKAMPVKIKDDSDEVQVKLHDGLQET